MLLEKLQLGYRIKRLFAGESGIVENVGYMPLSGNENYHPKDDFGNPLMQVTFRNTLGELVSGRTPVEYVEVIYSGVSGTKSGHSPSRYKQYKPGSKFP